MFTIHMSNRRPPEASLLIDFSDSSEDEKSKRPESEAAEPASPPDSSTQPQLTRRDENTSPTYITAMRISRCSHLCRCRCHSSQNRSRKANWAIPFIGSLLVEYRSAPRTQQAACSHKHCSATTDTAFEFKYYPPAWLWEGMVSFGASYHKAIGLQVALRPKRVLPPINPFFLSIIGPFENFCDAIRTGFLRVYPDDELVQHNVIELLLRCNKLAHVEVILHLWREFLPLLNFPRYQSFPC
ncbi:hypothetical protein B0J15DRAFT_68542 [Fusarium solani]|uniref:Uncharacterized protein n=1 Tax=Fusarium solani TaxID=169388 RepID=A0A9P9KCI3_FUSSL|nr:uncharacterized protein B0J15DRAFT_68542 [Fusarium solani]KAH7248009.1 hypothetical protein B0J15DRAFT_68542 [Fusarium solani]